MSVENIQTTFCRYKRRPSCHSTRSRSNRAARFRLCLIQLWCLHHPLHHHVMPPHPPPMYLQPVRTINNNSNNCKELILFKLVRHHQDTIKLLKKNVCLEQTQYALSWTSKIFALGIQILFGMGKFKFCIIFTLTMKLSNDIYYN